MGKINIIVVSFRQYIATPVSSVYHCYLFHNTLSLMIPKSCTANIYDHKSYHQPLHFTANRIQLTKQNIPTGLLITD